MTDQQWFDLVSIIDGKLIDPLPVGFIVDSPWLPNWYGINILDYFSNDDLWLNANLEVVEKYPDVMFLPGFWSEFGMCTEPSAFGARSTFPPNVFPHVHKVLNSPNEIDLLPKPNPSEDGLLPFVLNRLKLAQPMIEDKGHKIKFAVARGPLNIASFLMGNTEFLSTIMLKPDDAHKIIRKITDFLKDWISLQIETFPTIDGLLLLDDVIGSLGVEEFKTFGLPYFKELYSIDVKVKFLHNDAPCLVSAPFLNEIGINLFNMGYETSLNELKKITENKITLIGNISSRDVLAKGEVSDVIAATEEQIYSLNDLSRVIMSCGGGLPPAVSTENLNAFVQTVKNYNLINSKQGYKY